MGDKMNQIKMVIFDLDGTLTESKSEIDDTMVSALNELQKDFMVAVISGCSYMQFLTQFLAGLTKWDSTHNLWLLPTCGAELYVSSDNEKCCTHNPSGWTCEYDNKLSLKEKVQIVNAFNDSVKQYNEDRASGLIDISMGYLRDTSDPSQYGELAEDRGSQITFSMLGQQAPLKIKQKWDLSMEKRTYLAHLMTKRLKDFEIRVGGTTSIDITKRGIDKSYGVLNLLEICGLNINEVVFVGDALYQGGNDHTVKFTGIRCIETSGPEETLKIIEDIRGV